MALILDSNRRFANLSWGISDINLIRDPTDVNECEPWQYVPYDLQDLADWFYVRHKDPEDIVDSTRPFEALHVPAEHDLCDYLAEFRVQGVLKEFALTEGGNWDGTWTSRSKARQFAHIEDIPGRTVPWYVQGATVSKLRFATLRSIPGKHAASVQLDRSTRDALYIARQAFVRPSRSSHFEPVSRLDLRRRLPGGSLAGASHLIFQVGDFVDIGVTLEITKWKSSFHVHLCLDSVIQLKTAEDLTMELQQKELLKGPEMPLGLGSASPAKRGMPGLRIPKSPAKRGRDFEVPKRPAPDHKMPTAYDSSSDYGTAVKDDDYDTLYGFFP